MRGSNNANTQNYIHSVLLSFIPVSLIFITYLLINSFLYLIYSPGLFNYTMLILFLIIMINIISYRILESIMQFKIYWRSALLANFFLIGFMLTNQKSYEGMVPFGYYLMSLTFFHMSEFVFTALFNHSDISTDSFLLNHSFAYGIAAVSSWFEFFIELLIFPSMKKNLYFRLIGLFLVIGGEFFRKLAMYTAGTNFNHYVQENRQKDHVLVTNGVYKLIRHPSYFGWFYWSIGTQILLANPICIVGYTLASWKFFKDRITFEEYYLIKFFGKSYIEYQKKVPSGVPFVKGFVIVEESLD